MKKMKESRKLGGRPNAAFGVANGNMTRIILALTSYIDRHFSEAARFGHSTVISM